MRIFQHSIILLSSLVISSLASAQTLTDIVLFRADASGNSIGQGWNTRSGDFISNLYLRQGFTWINSGNSAAVSVAISLTSPGVYTFEYYAENSVGSNTVTTLGMNLFFNGNGVTPSISAFGSEAGALVANSAITSNPFFGSVAGSGSLSTTIGANVITLSAWTVATNSSNVNLVQQFDNSPGQGFDAHGIIELRVTTVPAPMGISIAGIAAVVTLPRRRR